jgi:phosphoglycerol transferase
MKLAVRPATLLSLGRHASYLAAFFLIFLSYWMNRYFGVPELDQIIYHLDFGVDGLALADPALQRRFVRWCIIAPLLALLLTVYLERRLRARLPPLLLRYLPLALLTAATVHWLLQVSALNHLSAHFGPDYFAAHYIPPGTVRLTELNPKNLVLIYVESLESGYGKPAGSADDLLQPLEQLHGTSFASFRQAPGTGWTIAGLVATQCGLPLKRVTLFDENTQGQALPAFLPGATCLSDILARHGYRNVFMGGASPHFAGKGKFLHEHAYHEVYGKEDWLRLGASPAQMNGWGLYDGELFDRAKRKLQQLQDSKQRFNLTILTVNTHEPEGHLSASCARRGHRGFRGVVACTAEDLAEFLAFVERSGYLSNTNVVVIGDHLARKNPQTARLSALPERDIYNLFISADKPRKNTDQLLHFDLLPTILEFNGFHVDHGRLGLGYSGFNQHQARAPAQRFDDMQASLMNRSPSYLALWSPGVSERSAAMAAAPARALPVNLVAVRPHAP